MDLSFYPPDVRAMMEMQLALSGGGGAAGGTPGPLPVAAPAQAASPAPFGPAIGLPAQSGPPPAAPPHTHEPNPLLAGNDDLRRLFAEHPELAPRNAAQWLDEREAHILGNDPPPGPAGMDPGFYQAMLDAGARPHASAGAPDAPVAQSPFAPPPTSLPVIAAPTPASTPAPAPSVPTPSLPAPAPAAPAPKSEGLSQLPQLAPVLSSLTPAPAAPARANIDNNVALPAATFTPAPKLPELPKFSGSLTPNMGAYSPAPQMPGYGLARTGSPYRAPQAPLPALPTFAQLADPGFQSGPGLSSAPDLLSGSQTYLPQPVDRDPLYVKYRSGKSLFA